MMTKWDKWTVGESMRERVRQGGREGRRQRGRGRQRGREGERERKREKEEKKKKTKQGKHRKQHEKNEKQRESLKKEVIRCLEKDEIIDFFQVVGLIYRSREELMDVRLLHSKFTWWLCHYFLFFENEIAMQRASDKGVWADAVWLHKQFLRLNQEVGRTINNNSIDGFITYEKSLK